MNQEAKDEVNGLTLGHHNTSSERVACEAWRTGTLGGVFDDGTSCLRTTRAWTRVPTPLRLTGAVPGALCIDGTLRPTVGRPPHVVSLARTRGVTADHATLRVRPTGSRRTRVAARLCRHGHIWTCTNTHAVLSWQTGQSDLK